MSREQLEQKVKALHAEYIAIVSELVGEFNKIQWSFTSGDEEIRMRPRLYQLRETKGEIERLYSTFIQSKAPAGSVAERAFSGRLDALGDEVSKVCNYCLRAYKLERGSPAPPYMNDFVDSALELITAIKSALIDQPQPSETAGTDLTASTTTADTPRVGADHVTSSPTGKNRKYLAGKDRVALLHELGIIKHLRDGMTDGTNDTKVSRLIAQILAYDPKEIAKVLRGVKAVDGYNTGIDPRNDPRKMYRLNQIIEAAEWKGGGEKGGE